MLDQLLDLLDRDKKKTPAGARRRGLGGLLDRLQHAVDAEGDDHRRPHRHHDRHDARRDDHDDDDLPLDRGRHGRRRDRDLFDVGDD